MTDKPICYIWKTEQPSGYRKVRKMMTDSPVPPPLPDPAEDCDPESWEACDFEPWTLLGTVEGVLRAALMPNEPFLDPCDGEEQWFDTWTLTFHVEKGNAFKPTSRLKVTPNLDGPWCRFPGATWIFTR